MIMIMWQRISFILEERIFQTHGWALVVNEKITPFINMNLGEPSKLKNGKSWSFGPTSGPPPLPGSWSTLKWKKFRCLFCILDYSEHFNFSWKCTILGGQKVGTGEPPPLAWKLSQLWPNFSRFPFGGPPGGSNNIMNWWDIASPFV